MTRRHSSSSTMCTGPPPATPATFTTTSSRPCAATHVGDRRRDRGLVGDVGDVEAHARRAAATSSHAVRVQVEADDARAFVGEPAARSPRRCPTPRR